MPVNKLHTFKKLKKTKKYVRIMKGNKDMSKKHDSKIAAVSKASNSIKKRKSKGYKANKKHKDTLFRRIFTCNREWTLALYNAVNNSEYTNPEDIVYTTIDDAVYMKMKNDISFLITDIMNFYEHQSTANPNMPVRMLIYAGMVYSNYAEDESNDYNIYSSALGKLPTPKCVCFYNGEKDKPEKTIHRLSDSFKGNISEDSDIEVTVTMININYGHNQKLMKACRPLMEYSWFVEEIRKNKSKRMTLENAIDQALDIMPEDYLIRGWLLKNRSEVKRMCITEYDEKKVKRSFEREAQRERERAEKAEKTVKKQNEVLKEKDDKLKEKDNKLKEKDNEIEHLKKQLAYANRKAGL